MAETLRETLAERIGRRLAAEGRRPLVVGLSGSQGSGKSTLAAGLAADLARQGIGAAVLSLDDLYLTREERARLAIRVHPLLATRGAPGTHDLALAFAAIAALERDEDPDLRWRSYVNRALERDYRTLFARLDYTVLLAAPGFDTVLAWRRQQERELAARTGGVGAGLMDDAALIRFIAHYERLTRHILAEFPDRADLVARLDEDRAVVAVIER